MTQEHPITPPTELVLQWHTEADNQLGPYYDYIATQAARWGADQELNACCEWIYKLMDRGLEWSMDLRIARRPKPPSLKEQGLKALDSFEGFTGSLEEVDIIRRALESLPS